MQLALVHVGVSITVVPVTSTLNRILIADMKLPATLVGLLVALPYLLSPLQVLVGHWTDRHLLWGRRRSPWMVIGGLTAAFGGYLTAHAALAFGDNFWLGLTASLIVFSIWGIGVNVASVSYLSLLGELCTTHAAWRSRAVSLMWMAMILSTIGTSVFLSMALAPYSDSALITALGAVWMVASLLILIGSANIEPAVTRNADPARGRSAETPLAAYRMLSTNPTARRFFLYLLLILVSIHAQDVLLEPFGAEALRLSIAATSRLTSLWGVGVFMTLLAGLPIVRRFGEKRSANVGAAVVALAFLVIILSGLGQLPRLFVAAVLLLGLGAGLMTVGNLSFMLEMTVPAAAGLYMGAWGVANFAGQALGNIASGLLRDLFFYLTGSSMAGYVTVFGLEIVGLLVAIRIFRDVSVADFQRDAEVEIADVLGLVGQ